MNEFFTDKLIDRYDRVARLYPVYLAVAPAIFLIVVLALGAPEWWSRLGAIAVAIGAPLFVVQFGRSAGKRKEAALFAWRGGAPALTLLRHRSPTSNPVTLERRHRLVEAATGVHLPTAEEERANPDAADGAYQSAVNSLKELTRDRGRFPLVFNELVNYGFRRNLWGLKPFGVSLAAASAASSAVILLWEVLADIRWSPAAPALSLGVSIVVLGVWSAVVTPPWVNQTAEAYAERLLASAELLARHAPPVANPRSRGR